MYKYIPNCTLYRAKIITNIIRYDLTEKQITYDIYIYLLLWWWRWRKKKISEDKISSSTLMFYLLYLILTPGILDADESNEEIAFWTLFDHKITADGTVKFHRTFKINSFVKIFYFYPFLCDDVYVFIFIFNPSIKKV